MVQRIEGVAFAESVVEVDGYRIRCFEAGDGEPALRIDVEGNPQLTRMDALLSQRHRLIVVELPGVDASAGGSARSARDLAHTLVAAARAFGLTRYSLLASSFGAAVALWQALEDGENIDALVLLAPGAIVPDGWRPPAGDRDFPFAPDNELEQHLPQVGVPTLVVFGTEDRVIPSEMGRVYRSSMPNCNLAFMYDAGHAIAADRPDAAAELVGDFLERHELFVVARDS